MKKQAANQVKLSVLADKDVVSKDSSSTRIIEVTVVPPLKETERERASLNLSLVLDRSGSMSGEKLEYVKQAAVHVLELLESKDKVSVTVYDDTVETIVPSQEVTDKFKLTAKKEIQKVQTGGSTFLSGGWLRGCEEAAGNVSESSINRTLLLTDGLANRGIQDPEELATHAREIYRRGIATSCFGVGQDYDEHLLEAIANTGGGTFHYLETMNAIPLEFEREFEELVNVSLRDTELSLVLPDGVKAKVSAGYDAEQKGNKVNISLGSLYSGKEKRIYVSLQFDKSESAKPLEVKVNIRGKGEGDYLFEDVGSIVLTVVSEKDESDAPLDQALMDRFTVVDMADKANEALKRERAGDRDSATQILNSSIREHSANMSASMRSSYQFMSDQLQMGLDENARKRYHQEGYSNKRGREFIRDYQLDLVNGHLIARVENYSVLIDTGIPISIGTTRQWHFMNNVHDLSNSYMGVTLDYISRMVGTNVDIILGTDILRRLNLLIQAPKHRITFAMQTLPVHAAKIPLSDFMGVPIVNVLIDRIPFDAFIDTGAKLSYVDATLLSLHSTLGTEKDFYPGLGEFETQVYEVPFQIGSHQITLRCGELPGALEKTLFVTGKRALIGTEIFSKFQVQLALPENGMYLK